MPNCFNLTKLGDDKPSTLQDVDRDICQALDIPFSDTEWAGNWYHSIGFALACGQSWDQIEATLADYPGSLAIAHYLKENYKPSAWAER